MVTSEYIEKWNHASGDWFTPKAENDFKTDGRFNYRMEAKDGRFGCDFQGINEVNEKIEGDCLAALPFLMVILF